MLAPDLERTPRCRTAYDQVIVSTVHCCPTQLCLWRDAYLPDQARAHQRQRYQAMHQLAYALHIK